MKKLLALLMVLMLLAPAAMAEDSTLYWLSLFDPQLTVDDETVADLTGLNLDLNLGVTDAGVNSLILDLYAGEEYDYVTGLFAQLDANGLGLYLNGMQNVYQLDLNQLTGADLSAVLGALPLRSLLATLDLSEMDLGSTSVTAETRIGLLESLLGGFVYETFEADGATIHRFSISREQSAASFGSLLESLQSTPLGEEIPEDAELSMELAGEITAKGHPNSGAARWTVEAEGNLFVAEYGDETAFPLTVSYADDMENVELTVNVANDYDEELTLALSSSHRALEDGREEVNLTVTLGADDEDFTLSYIALPDEESARMDYRLELSTPDEDEGFAVDVITDFDPESAYSFYIALTVKEYGEENMVDLYFVGDPANDPESGMVDYGWVQLTAGNAEHVYGLSFDLQTYRQDMDTESWALDTSAAVPVLDMTDEELNDVMTEAMSVLQETLQVLTESMPALADLG